MPPSGNTVVLQEDLDNASKRMDTAKSDLDSIIRNTTNSANAGLDASIQGDVRTACVELIEGWQQKTNSIVEQLVEFRTNMLSVNQNAGDESAANARSISSIDFSALG